MTELDDEHRARKEGGGAVGDGNGKPHSVARTEPPLGQMRKKENAGHEEEELAREREENALAGHTNALEEGRRHDLHADHGPKSETILSPCADAAMREASLAKSDTSCTGKRWLAAKPKVVITVATTRVYFTTETKRSNLRAP